RAVDPVSKTRFVVAKAPDDAELTPARNGSASPGAEAKQSSPPAVVLPPIEGAASKPATEAAASTEAAAASEAPVESREASSVSEAALPDFHVVRKRAEEPSERTPITYREFAYSVKPDTSVEAATALIISRFREVSSSLAA